MKKEGNFDREKRIEAGKRDEKGRQGKKDNDKEKWRSTRMTSRKNEKSCTFCMHAFFRECYTPA